METLEINKDIITICVAAESFPAGVETAFEELAALAGGFNQREMYGISYWENGGLNYRAACSESSAGESEKLGAETYTIKKGTYICETIKDWQNHKDQFETAFKKLGNSDENTENVGIEWYQGNDVRCMLKLKE